VRAVDYALRQAWASLKRSAGASALSVVAIALAVIVLGVLLLLTWNAQQVMAQWASAAEFSVFLRDDATSEQRGAIETALDQSGIVAGREYVSKSQALARFRREFAELASLTSGFADNPFPASVEVRLRPEAEGDGRADALVRRVAALPGVGDVRYDSEWLSTFGAGLRTVRGAGLMLAAVMALAAAVTVAAVVRIGLYARRDEIEIMELVGAPLAFIRGPFVAEGLLQGGGGAVLALILLWTGFALARGWWGSELGAMLNGLSVAFLPFRLCAVLVGGGMAVGAAGGLAAARHAGRGALTEPSGGR
jgi:cell division transport system permease protein